MKVELRKTKTMFNKIVEHEGMFTQTEMVNYYFRSNPSKGRRIIQDLLDRNILVKIKGRLFPAERTIIESSKTGTAQGRMVCVFDKNDELLFGRRHKYTQSIVTDFDGNHYAEINSKNNVSTISRYVPEQDLLTMQIQD